MAEPQTNVPKQPAKSTALVDPNNTTVLVVVAITVLMCIMAIGIVSIVIFAAGEDQKSNIAILVGAFSTVLTPLIGVLLVKKVDAVHVQLNQRMSESLEKTYDVGYLQGQEIAKATAKIEADAIAQTVRETTAAKSVEVAEITAAVAEKNQEAAEQRQPAGIAETTAPVEVVIIPDAANPVPVTIDPKAAE